MATALITGASKGLGAEFAWQLAAARHDLVLVARSADALDTLATQLRGAAGVDVEVLVADLSNASDLDKVAARVGDPDRPVSLLVNNAGYGIGKDLVDSTWEVEKAVLDVLVTAPLRLSQVAAKAMTERGHGAILNVSSIAAHLANTSYAAHKRWVLDFTEALATQLRGTGVTATVVLPGLVKTEFHSHPTLSHMRTEFHDVTWLTAEQVVSSALAAVRRKDVVVTPSARYAIAGAVMKALPSSLTRRAASMRTRH
ncbi:SDR family NAD(P)-dependent oxidoreductase [Demequina sp. B12]|uniref:SDR family NAD(P)-dependent oxidoreductase n=1 Tax=Demequina sp. B12 TaxID=2992757 RepID=UPI00237B3A6D|nr:SDR family NAD(P)-dependent oxidoreductase [Demequina sp. B12]MDE0572004.1 SDR family NAD(P)-dependent oxidoreductase [Demequina sp. B12]